MQMMQGNKNDGHLTIQNNLLTHTMANPEMMQSMMVK
jgi:hypothetical protein